MSNLAIKIPERFTDENGWRWYGNKISVTTVLENAVANPSLMSWFKKNTEKKIEQVKTKTANFGTDAHKYFEAILMNEKIVDPNLSHVPHIMNFNKWIDDNKVKAKHCEISMQSERLGIAGTADFIGSINQEEILADWKTGTRYRITNGWQMASYRMMAIENGIVSKDCGLMGVQIDRNTADIKTFKYEHIEFVEHAFLCALEVFKALHFNKLKKVEWPWLKERAI